MYLTVEDCEDQSIKKEGLKRSKNKKRRSRSEGQNKCSEYICRELIFLNLCFGVIRKGQTDLSITIIVGVTARSA